MAMLRWTFASDAHAQNHLPQCIALVAARQRDWKPDLFVFGGDMVEFDSVTSFCRTRIMETGAPHTIKEEAKSCFDWVLSPICNSLPSKCEKIYLEGNHEWRAIRYIGARAQALEGLVDLNDVLGCSRLGIKYISSKAGNAIYNRGPAWFMHGVYIGVNPARMHLERFGGPLCVFGHTHKESRDRRKRGNGQDELSIGVGCLSGDAPFSDFDNYTRGFAEGWLNEETWEFGATHCNISGEKNTYLYLQDAEYSAKCRYDKKGGEHWMAERVADSKRSNTGSKGTGNNTTCKY